MLIDAQVALLELADLRRPHRWRRRLLRGCSVMAHGPVSSIALRPARRRTHQPATARYRKPEIANVATAHTTAHGPSQFSIRTRCSETSASTRLMGPCSQLTIASQTLGKVMRS